MSHNPLIDYPDLPPFSEIRPEHVKPAVEQLVGAGRERIRKVLQAYEVERNVTLFDVAVANYSGGDFLGIIHAMGTLFAHSAKNTMFRPSEYQT